MGEGIGMKNRVASLNTTCFDLIYSGLARLPAEGEELLAEDFRAVLGGGSPATLLNLAGLGVEVVIGTFLGQDVFSRLAREAYEELGVTPHNLYRGNGEPVMVSTAMSTRRNRTFVSSRPDSAARVADEEAYGLLCGSRIVYMNEAYPEVNRRLKADGAVLFYDTGWAEDMRIENRSEQLRLADYFAPNREDALAMTGAATPEAALQKLAEFVKNPIIKLGGQGCLILEDGKIVRVPAVGEFVNVDSTGAGDAFAAGFLYGVLHGFTLRESALLGNLTGGKATTAVGCLSARFTQRELLELFIGYNGHEEKQKNGGKK